MKLRLLTTSFLSCILAIGAESKGPVKTKIVEGEKAVIVPAEETKPAEEKLPDVEDAIPSIVKSLAEPAMIELPAGVTAAITAASDKAQAHVNQGIYHLHGGWEFEASRHFAAAMREDPECLMAHWGMVMSTLTPSPETGPARNAASDRMLELVNKGYGTELERGYAYGLIKYMEEGPEGAAQAFQKIAEKFPNDLHATIFAALFSRTGYDEGGNITPGQEDAEKKLLGAIEKNPQNPIPLYALLSIRAEAPDLNKSVELARKLCQMVPDYAPYFHLLGHYEWRTGQHGKAASAFGRASTILERWMQENKAIVADCPEWVKSECYRIVSIASKGEFDTAFAAARQVASTPFADSRAGSSGARLLLWEAKTLPARILLQRGLAGSVKDANNSLPKPDEIKNTRKKSLAYLWIDGLRIVLEAQRLIDAGDLDGASEVLTALAHHGEMMSKAQASATASGERSAWTRAFRALEVLASELNGRKTLAGPKERIGTAYNWFTSATDRQHPASMMMPPLILTPMATRLGEYYLAADKPAEAIESYNRALAAFPNDMNALLGLKKSYQKAKLAKETADTEQKIQELKAQ
jgi:tetratricopeptide (TPR) repeat protein